MEGEYIPKDSTKEKEPKISGVLRQSLITDLITLVTGLFVYFGSSYINKIIGIVVGSFILVFGIYHIYKCYRDKKLSISSSGFIFSIFLVTIGIFIICSPLIVTQALTLMLGILLFIMGINKTVYGILLKKETFGIWVFSLIIGLLLILFGLLLIFNPFANIVITKIFGIVLVITAVVDLINLFIIKKESKGLIELHW